MRFFRVDSAVDLILNGGVHVEGARCREMLVGVGARSNRLCFHRCELRRGPISDLQRDDAAQVGIHCQAIDSYQTRIAWSKHDLSAVSLSIPDDEGIITQGTDDDGTFTRVETDGRG